MLNLGANCLEILNLCKMSNNIPVMMIIFKYYYDNRKITFNKKNNNILRNLYYEIYYHASYTNNTGLKHFIVKYLDIINR